MGVVCAQGYMWHRDAASLLGMMGMTHLRGRESHGEAETDFLKLLPKPPRAEGE